MSNVNKNTEVGDVSLEAESYKRNKKKVIQDLILETVAVTGLITASLIAPDVIRMMKKTGLIPKKRQSEVIYASKKRLIELGYLKSKDDTVVITEEGRKYLARNTFYRNQNNQKVKWDKKWRVLIFDIPENLRYLRNEIRNTLVSAGFYLLQQSVWVYPHNCEALITLLKIDLEAEDYLIYMIVDQLDKQDVLIKHFKLK